MDSDGILQFTGYDYGVSIALLTLSALIGVYFMTKQTQNNPDEYLLGSKSMGLFPISISLIVWQVSGMTLLGLPVEVYTNGTQQWASLISVIGVGLAFNYIYLPVFYDLQCKSCFTYLELRFSRQVKNLASILFTISMMMFIPTVIYIPALAFNQVSGISLNIITTVTCAVCIFYTTVGGLKAVVWTDALQFFMMLAAVFSIIVMGSTHVGGFRNILDSADRSHRLIIFNLNPSPFERLSFWSVTIGLTFQMMSSICISPTVIQRCVSLSSCDKVKRAIFIFLLGITLFNICAHITGMQMYAKYETCDPYLAGSIRKIDQVLPYFVMDVGGSIPGLPGLFIAGIFAAAQSMKIFCFSYASEEKSSNIMKLIVVVLGLILLILVFFVDKLGQVYELSLTLSSTTTGTMLGIFTMGMICRSANNEGVISGAVVSVLVVGLAMIGAQRAKKETMLPMRSDGCNVTKVDAAIIPQILQTTTSTILNDIDDDIVVADTPFWLFRISFMYYAVIGFLLVLIVGYPVSVMTNNDKHFNEILLAPYKRREVTRSEYERL